ncbi:hypothetical protein HanPSC8_Chr17g0789481 [Helianthus annuus]|nr:hypothetical protein HanPSC8_Chr17g0789481 [Helianthus annuus]
MIGSLRPPPLDNRLRSFSCNLLDNLKPFYSSSFTKKTQRNQR